MRFCFFYRLCLITDLASIFQSGGNSKLRQDIDLKKQPDKKYGQYDE